MPLWKRSKINCSTSTTAFGNHPTSQYSSEQKTARSHRIHVNGLFFICFNRPSRHDQSAFSGDRMPGHAEACHPNGPYDGVRVEACALSVACVDHRSSRRSSHLGSCRAVHMPKADHRRAEHRYFPKSRVVPWILLFDLNRWVLRGMRTIPSQPVFQTRSRHYRYICTSVLGKSVRRPAAHTSAAGNR